MRRAQAKRRRPKTADLDARWSAAVRAPCRCSKCGKVRALHAHHVIHRRFRRWRWVIGNGVALCADCHRWAHDNPLAFRQWIWKAFPMATLDLHAACPEANLRKGMDDA